MAVTPDSSFRKRVSSWDMGSISRVLSTLEYVHFSPFAFDNPADQILNNAAAGTAHLPVCGPVLRRHRQDVKAFRSAISSAGVG
jgi:hypothetical protein